MEAIKLFELVAKNEGGTHKFDSSEYLFPKQIVNLWGADTQYDINRPDEREVWGEVGLGSQSYLNVFSPNA